MAYFVGTVLNRLAIGRFSTRQLMRAAMISLSLWICMLALESLFLPANAALWMATVSLMFFSLAFVLPNYIAMQIARMQNHPFCSTALALSGALVIGICSLLTAAASSVHLGSALPLALIFTACTMAGWVLFYLNSSLLNVK
ncbi:MAG TPA: hypothetical protein EYO59_07470 [Chromatiaceae bacterium]|nr:hypothetical protein [Chromatiaceae bacterium]